MIDGSIFGLDAWRWLVVLAFLCVEAWLASLLVFQERRVVHQWLTPFDVTEPTLPWYASAFLLCWKAGSVYPGFLSSVFQTVIGRVPALRGGVTDEPSPT